jgi:hypothetical protein
MKTIKNCYVINATIHYISQPWKLKPKPKSYGFLVFALDNEIIFIKYFCPIKKNLTKRYLSIIYDNYYEFYRNYWILQRYYYYTEKTAILRSIEGNLLDKYNYSSINFITFGIREL